jgi:hypothetical protein
VRILRIASIIAVFAFVMLFVGLNPGLVSHADMPAAALHGRWLDANLTTLTLTAYDGNTPVYSAPMSAGKPGYETPMGVFRITHRVYNDIMDSATLGVPRSAPDGYYIPNVLYTQYISAGGGIAIHSNYWTDDSVFGRSNTSHGCLAMRTSDARFFWDFAGVGTPVVIHLESPALRTNPTAESSNASPTQVFMAQTWGRESSSVLMPELKGLPAAEAELLLSKLGLQATYLNFRMEDLPQDQKAFYTSVQPDCVFHSVPRAGESVPVGSGVRLAVR